MGVVIVEGEGADLWGEYVAFLAFATRSSQITLRTCSLLLKSTHPIISASLSMNIASVSANGVELSPSPSVGLSVRVCLSMSVRKVYCGKMDDWIRMPFGMVSGVGRRMGVMLVRGDRRMERGS